MQAMQFVNIAQNILSSFGQHAGGLGWVLCLGLYKAEIKMSAMLYSHLEDPSKN